MKEKISYTFPSGLEVNGTVEEIINIAKALKVEVDFAKLGVVPRGYYPSESKGLIKVSTMADYHIRRALLKRGKDYFTEIFDATDTNTEFLRKFTALTEDKIVVDLFTELANRKISK